MENFLIALFVAGLLSFGFLLAGDINWEYIVIAFISTLVMIALFGKGESS